MDSATPTDNSINSDIPITPDKNLNTLAPPIKEESEDDLSHNSSQYYNWKTELK